MTGTDAPFGCEAHTHDTEIEAVSELREKVITYVATHRHPWNPAETVDLLLAAVRHEHGERIAKAIEGATTIYRPGQQYAARIARDLSPPP